MSETIAPHELGVHPLFGLHELKGVAIASSSLTLMAMAIHLARVIGRMSAASKTWEWCNAEFG